MRKYVMFSLLFCLLCLPASAGDNWQLTFENTESDAGGYAELITTTKPTLRVPNYYTWPSTGMVYSYSSGNKPGPVSTTFTLNKGFTSYFAYTSAEAAKEGSAVATIKGYSASGACLFSFSKAIPRSDPVDSLISRKEILKTTSGYALYIDGNLILSYPTTNLSPVEYVVFTHTGGSKYLLSRLFYFFDDFSNSYWTLGGNDAISGSNYHLSYGLAPSVARTQIVKLFGPDGNCIKSSDLGSSSTGVLSYDASIFSTPGEYTFRMYAVYSGGVTSYLASKSVVAGEIKKDSDCIIELNADSYSSGDEVKIYTFTSPYTSGYNLLLYSKEKLEKTIAIKAQDQNTKFIIPDDALTGNWLAAIKNPDGATEVNTMFSVTGNLYPDTSIKLDKSGYALGGDLQIFYDDLPPGTTVLLKGSLNAVDVFSKTWENRAGAGIIPYTLPDSETYEVIQVYASKNGVILDSDLSIMSLGSDYILEGTVLNSVTNSPISPGEICLNGVVKLLDEKGHYQISGPAGSHSVTVVSEGFHHADFDVTLSAPLTSRNFYLIPVTEETGGSIYGATANYDTGEPVGLALVEITNGVDSYQTISNSKSGRFSFSQIPDNSTWTIKATKSEYFTSSDSVNVSGATMHLCRLVSEGSGVTPGDGSGVTPGDGSGSSSGSSPGSDRPGRAAAKNSMAEFEMMVPGLLGFIVLAIFLKTVEGL